MEKINRNQLEELLYHEEYAEEKLIESLLEILKKQMNTMIPEMKENLQKKNYNKISELAHSLKSSAWQLGLQKMGDMCLILEREGRSNKQFEFRQIIQELELEFIESERLLFDYISSKNRATA